jgi:hypothetical protein
LLTDDSAERFLDARSNLCYKRELDVEQDHHFGRDGCRADYSAGESHGAVMHSFQRASTKSVQAGLLRQQNVLRDFKPAQVESIAAADES